MIFHDWKNTSTPDATCGERNHVGVEWVEWDGGFNEKRPCTHCRKMIGGLEVFQYAWSSVGAVCFGLCRSCYEQLPAH